MFDDYNERFYTVLANRSKALMKDNYAKAKELAAWKEDIAQHWEEIELVSIRYDESLRSSDIEVGDIISAQIILNKHNFQGELGLEIVQLRTDLTTNVDSIRIFPIELEKTEGSLLYFKLNIKASQAGAFKYGIRVYPSHKDIPHRMDFAYVKWINS
jgi:starch phosphorylase